MARRGTAAQCATSRPRAPDSAAHDAADSDANPSGTCGAHDDTGSDANATATCGAHDDAAAHGANNASGKCAHGKCAHGPDGSNGLTAADANGAGNGSVSAMEGACGCHACWQWHSHQAH